MRRLSSVASPICVAILLTCSGCPTPPVPVPGPPTTADKFVNWESAHVSPMTLAADGTKLLIVNTPDNALDIFDLSSGVPVLEGRVPVGLDPVSVRARSSNEAWVVNRVSDSVSIVDLSVRAVVRTLRVRDEPGDVVFAGERAFISCLEPSRVVVYDLSNLDAELTTVPIEAYDPRAMTVSADGSSVYVAVFESGNHTSIVEKPFVSDLDTPYAGMNPPPNSGWNYSPPMREGLESPKLVSQIVRKDVVTNRWLDDNGGDWSNKIHWDVHDHDLAIIDTTSLSVRYVTGLMNINMHLAVRPDGKVVVIGTEAINQVRFEPNLTGRFVQSVAAVVDPAGADDAGSKQVFDLNPHLADVYQQKQGSVSAALRDLSIADPRGIVWQSDGSKAYITGMGTNNVIEIDAAGGRMGQTNVGEGPTGIVLDEARARLYVLNRFDASISVLDAVNLAEVSRVPFYDPTPTETKAGRPLLYDARRTSGLGVTACASCHVDTRMDGLSWDLGDPSGEMKPFDQICDDFNGLISSPFCEDFHPMKGPMTTQSLQSIIGTEPFHWRGDRPNLAAFNPAFVTLLGGDSTLTDDEMRRLSDFLAGVHYPPNPHRNLDDSLAEHFGNGSPVNGERVFTSGNHDNLRLNCNFCHAGHLGTNQKVTRGSSLDGTSLKVPQLRGLYKKTGFLKDSQRNDRGFGFVHDGLFSNLPEFLHFKVFTFTPGEPGEQDRRDLESFLLSFPTDTHPAVGTQVTLDGANGDNPEISSLVDLMLRLADDGKISLVVHGRAGGIARGYAYIGGNTFQSDRSGETVDASTLRSSAGSDAQQTWTAVPLGSETRIGIDHNNDGILDGDQASP